jgi:hypothetical protein
MTAEAATKPSRTKKNRAAEQPQADTLTGDLLGAQPPFEVAPVKADSAAVGELALATLSPAKFVAEIFQPFKDRFAALREEADIVAVDEEDFQRLVAQQDALPEDQRRVVSRLDLTTKDGMTTAIKLRAGFRDDVRLATEKTRVAKKEPFLKIGNELDSQSKPIKEGAAAYESRFDRAIKAEEERKEREKREAEEREAARLKVVRAKIDAIAILPTQLAAAGSAPLIAALEQLANMPDPDEAEFGAQLGEMVDAINAAGTALASLLEAAQKREEEEAARILRQQEEEQRLADERAANERAAAELARQRDEIEEQQRNLKAAQEQQELASAAVGQLQVLATAGGDAISLHRALVEVESTASDEGRYGPMALMVQMARDVAAKALTARLAERVAEELPAAWDEALTENARIDAARSGTLEASVGTITKDGVWTAPEQQGNAQHVDITFTHDIPAGRFVVTAPDGDAAQEFVHPLCGGHSPGHLLQGGIDWDAPMVPQPSAAPAPAIDDSAAVQQFQQAVRTLYSTRGMSGIYELLEDELVALETEERDALDTLGRGRS